MAYDPKDPADKAIVKGLVDAAVAEAVEEANEAHEAEIAGLKKKRTELLATIKDLRSGGSGSDNSEEITKLEGELATANKEVKRLTKELATSQATVAETTEALDKKTKQANGLATKNNLTAALADAKVDPDFNEAVTAMLGSRVVVAEDAKGELQATIDGKPLGEFVKEWSQGDQGKRFVLAANNSGGGGGGNGGGGQGSPKKLSELNEKERIALNSADPVAFKALVDADKAERNKAPAG